MSPAASQIIRLHEHGGPEVLRVEQEALSRPGKGEVLVRHEAIGLNFIDTYFRTGLYPVALPTSLGNEAAGIVEAVGPNVDEVRVGDRVGYFTGPLGSYAARRNVSADRLVLLPVGITAEQAAGGHAQRLHGRVSDRALRPSAAGRLGPGPCGSWGRGLDLSAVAQFDWSQSDCSQRGREQSFPCR